MLKLSIVLIASFASMLAHAADFDVKGYGIHTPAGVTYYYTLTNNTASNSADPRHVSRFEIGVGKLSDVPELIGLPPIISPRSGMLIYPGNGVLSMTAPTGWRAFEGGMQEHPNHTLGWGLDRDAQDNTIDAAALLPGQTLTGLSATRVTENPGYLNAKFAVLTFGIYTVPGTGGMKQSTGFVQKQDTLPTVLSITLTPNSLKPGKKLLSVAAAITATDNYDPMPAIVLESITANQTLKSGDVSGAAFSTDDRSFSLKPVKGRVYTVTYSATDGSGNKSTASATVTVRQE